MTLTSEALPVVMPTKDLFGYATTDCDYFVQELLQDITGSKGIP